MQPPPPGRHRRPIKGANGHPPQNTHMRRAAHNANEVRPLASVCAAGHTFAAREALERSAAAPRRLATTHERWAVPPTDGGQRVTASMRAKNEYMEESSGAEQPRSSDRSVHCGDWSHS